MKRSVIIGLPIVLGLLLLASVTVGLAANVDIGDDGDGAPGEPVLGKADPSTEVVVNPTASCFYGSLGNHQDSLLGFATCIESALNNEGYVVPTRLFPIDVNERLSFEVTRANGLEIPDIEFTDRDRDIKYVGITIEPRSSFRTRISLVEYAQVATGGSVTLTINEHSFTHVTQPFDTSLEVQQALKDALDAAGFVAPFNLGGRMSAGITVLEDPEGDDIGFLSFKSSDGGLHSVVLAIEPDAIPL